jgi:hypothetical protein
MVSVIKVFFFNFFGLVFKFLRLIERCESFEALDCLHEGRIISKKVFCKNSKL